MVTGLLPSGFGECPAEDWLPITEILAQGERSSAIVHPHEILNVSQFHPSERLSAWQSALKHTFTDLMPETAYEGNFGGVIETINCSGLRISRITAAAQRVHRRVKEIERSKSNSVFLNVHLGGAGSVLHSRGTTTLAVGDCILVDPSEPYVLEFSSTFRQLCIQLPEWCLREQLDIPLEAVFGRRFTMSTGAGRVLLAALDLTLRGADSGDTVDSSAKLLMQVMNHSLNETLNGPSNGVYPKTPKTDTAKVLRQYIGQNFRDESISPKNAASALGCSLRNVHKTCHNLGTTFGKLVLEARLSAASQALSYTKHPQPRVSNIAYDAGFSDISHFCKVFRHKFGVSPTEFRKQRSC